MSVVSLWRCSSSAQGAGARSGAVQHIPHPSVAWGAQPPSPHRPTRVLQFKPASTRPSDSPCTSAPATSSVPAQTSISSVQWLSVLPLYAPGPLSPCSLLHWHKLLTHQTRISGQPKEEQEHLERQMCYCILYWAAVLALKEIVQLVVFFAISQSWCCCREITQYLLELLFPWT